MKKSLLLIALLGGSVPSFANETTLINGLDYGPLAKLEGTWKTVPGQGIDVAPAQDTNPLGKGAPAVEPFYETITFEPAADATNASEQYLVAMYYKQEVFRTRDNGKFHDQRGYLIYDKKNDMVYNSYCIPRAVCVVAEGKAGDVIKFTTPKRGIAESSFMSQKDTTTNFLMTLDMSEKDIIRYSQTTSLEVYGKPFAHTDSSTLKRVK